MRTANRPSVQAVVRHAISDNGEFMLCGLAFDEDEDGPTVETKPGETVTCVNCRNVLDYVRKTFRGYRHVPNSAICLKTEAYRT